MRIAEHYRAILSRYGGCERATDLDLFGFDQVMRHFTVIGFRSTWTKRTFGDRAGMTSPAQVELMGKLWQQYHNGDDENDTDLNTWLSK